MSCEYVRRCYNGKQVQPQKLDDQSLAADFSSDLALTQRDEKLTGHIQ